MATNPRWKTGRRRKYQERFRAMGLPCALCGRPIDYSLPYYVTDEQGRKRINMQAFCIDEKWPVSKWKEGGFNSAADAANTWENLQPCHVICNARKGNKTNFAIRAGDGSEPVRGQAAQTYIKYVKRARIQLDGKW